MNLPYNFKKISDKDYRWINCIIINNSTKIFIFHFIYLGGSFWNQFKACTRWLKKSIKQTKKNKKRKKKKNKTKQKQKKKKTNKNKNKKGPVPLTCGWLHYFSPCNNPPLSKWLRLKWQVAQSFHQTRSHDLFWKGVGPPQNKWTFWTKKLFELIFLGP